MHRTQVFILSLLVVILTFLLETSFGEDSKKYWGFFIGNGLRVYSIFWIIKILNIYKFISNNGFSNLTLERKMNYYILLYSLPILQILFSLKLAIVSIFEGRSSSDIGPGFQLAITPIEIIYLSVIISFIASLIKHNSWNFL